ncbi:hypothetical protein ABK905_01060 [Acerihabitans sp. KWT182]|uniref:Uncharacterized protein n=1 Tax=Acerihabitans sp. KWT182 TaxID=3157919 RepID=A0AAU7Q9T5_9GAMM
MYTIYQNSDFQYLMNLIALQYIVHDSPFFIIILSLFMYYVNWQCMLKRFLFQLFDFFIRSFLFLTYGQYMCYIIPPFSEVPSSKRQIIAHATNHIHMDNPPANAPAQLAASINCAANTSTTSVKEIAIDTLFCGAMMGALFLSEFLAVHSLRGVNNYFSESQSFKPMGSLQKIGIRSGTVMGALGGLIAGPRSTSLIKTSLYYQRVMVVFAGAYLGVISGYLLSQIVSSFVENDQ